MNYYEHHLGDYAKDTGHLSMMEHGAYRILLDRYYSTERGIQADQAHRLARARSDEECRAVDVVLEEFFELVDGVWLHRRVEREIVSANKRISAAQENGKKGGRPPKKPNSSDSETQQKPTGLSPGSDSETQPKAHQSPDTNLQSPGEKREDAPAAQPPAPKAARATRLPTDWRLPDTWMSWALLEQPSWTPDDALRVADSFRDYWAAKGGADARKVDWEATWRNWVRREKSSGLSRTHQAPSRQDRYAADAAIIRDLARGKTEIDMGTIDATR
jgi:uncharacterized protein YdaU (DUF1376 family)